MSEPATHVSLACEACDGAIAEADEAGWQCECGVVVCPEPVCFDEYFKSVGGGEGVRCRTCGHLS